jgi:hypothetical protein
MGYIGLLLNAPYKIDSMVWMRLWIRFVLYAGLLLFLLGRSWLYEPESILRKKDLKGGCSGFGGF